MAASVRTRSWQRFFRAGATAIAVAATGCDFGRGVGGCAVESRALEHRAETRSDSRVGNGSLQLSETRGAENRTFVLWQLRVAPFAAGARTVSLRLGPPELPGRLLYQFPLLNPVPESGVITQVFVRTPYAGAVPFAELWELIQREPVSFEAVFDGDMRPLRVGPLLRTASSDWQDACS
jgi:hypothetical protein